MKTMRVLVMSDIHYCRDGWYGVSQGVKRERLCADLENEYANAPYDALLLLGDYSLDFWVWDTKGTYLTQGVSNTQLFKEQCLPRMAPEGVAVRMIAGNHEQYGEQKWENITGHKRRDHLVCGPILFVMLDTFGGDLDPTEHSDGTYIGADVEDITTLMAQHPDKYVVLCAHWFDAEKESAAFRRLLCEESRILCLLCGHDHVSRVTDNGAEWGNKPILHAGNYSYSGEKNAVRCLNGYREVCIGEAGITSKYIVPPHTYTVEDVTFTTEYAEQDRIEISYPR